MIDKITFQQGSAVLAQALRVGRNPLEALDHAGLLLTEDLRQNVRITVLKALHERMHDWSPAEYLFERNPVGPHTPQDMFEAIDRFVERYIEYLEAHPE